MHVMGENYIMLAAQFCITYFPYNAFASLKHVYLGNKKQQVQASLVTTSISSVQTNYH